jgi:hypothetical protein
MKTTTVNTTWKHFLALGPLLALLLVGCAKELEERLPDNADRDIHTISSFSQAVTLETVGSNPVLFQRSVNAMEERFLATNEVPLYSVRFVKGPQNLAHLFQELKVEAAGPGEKIEVVFRLTEGRVSAFRVVDRDSLSLPALERGLSTASAQLVRSEKGQLITPLFHYSVTYGHLKERLNSIDEPTRFRDFEAVNASRASHIRVTATPENRKLDGIYAEANSNIMVRSLIDQQILSTLEVGRMFTYGINQETVKALSPVTSSLYMEVIDGHLFVYRITRRDSLNAIKQGLLANNDRRIRTCLEEQVQKSGLAQSDCILEAVLSQRVDHVRLDLRSENGQFTGSVRIENDVDPASSQLVRLPLERRVQVIRYDDLINTEEQNVFARQGIDGVAHNRDEISTLFNGIPESIEQVYTRVVGNNLLLMVPRSVKSLNDLEYAAFRSGDERFMSCPAELLNSWKSEEECVLVPTQYRRVTHANIRLRANANNDLDEVIVDQDVDRSSSSILRIDTQQAPSRYVYAELIGTGNNIVTVKSRDFDLDAEYLYVPYTHGTPREVLAANPFFKGQEKIVRLRFVREGLEVYEQERDERFRNNALNDKPVLLINGSHIGYECIRDSQGDCTMMETISTHARWNEAPLFLPEPRQISVQELNLLDLMSAESDPCVRHVGTQVTHTTFEKGVINIHLEKTYKTSDSWRCIIEHILDDRHNYRGLSNAGFKVQYSYSLVRLDKLITPNYEPVAYPVSEHTTFGFFKDYERRLNDFFDSRRVNENFLLNRWNPKRRELVYHLSDTFNEPGQELIKQATYRAVEGINRSLQQANTGLRIRLVEPSGKVPGDLRHNVIQLITDPLSNGLLGYAPSATNPRTGEIVNAHINMYSGVIQTLVPRVWENMVDHTIRELREKNANINSRRERFTGNIEDERPDLERSPIDPREMRNLRIAHGNTRVTAAPNRSLENMDETVHQAMLTRMRRTRPTNSDTNANQSAIERRAEIERNRLDFLSKNSATAVEFFRVADTAKALLPGIVDIPGVKNPNGTLKRWNELSAEQQRAAGNIIAPFTYTSTFVHEFGHNLGLRHNFAGSFDRDNFYTEDEARALGLNTAPTYSSIMDYAYSEMNELSVFGRYDIAALRFAYAREVELQDGQIARVETTLTELENELRAAGTGIRQYRYCTDENAGLSASCSRFDEGTSLTEITHHLIQRYEDLYRYINFRDGRNNFYDSNVLGTTIFTMGLFERIRDMFEEWEFFGTFFGNDFMAQGCSPADAAQYPICGQINDRRDAAQKAGNFFITVLKTPDHLCAVLTEDEEGNQVVKTHRFREIYQDHFQFDDITRNDFPMSCFDPRIVSAINEGLGGDNGRDLIKGVVVGETGRFMNDIRGNDDNIIYANDRTVIGTWYERLLATRALVKRQKDTSLTETGHMSFAEHPVVRPQFRSLMNHLLLGAPLENPVPFKDQQGNTFMLNYSINDEVIEGTADDLYGLKRFFGLNTDSGAETSLLQGIMNMIGAYSLTNDRSMRDQALAFHNEFAIRRSDITHVMDHSRVLSMAVGDTVYSSVPSNTFGHLMLSSLQAEGVLEHVARTDRDMLIRVIQNRLQPQLPDLTEIEEFAMTIPEQLMEQFIQIYESGMTPEDFLKLMQANFPADLSMALYTMYVELGGEGMQRILDLKASLGQPPADASDLERSLYEFDASILMDFAQGKLEEKNERYEDNLRYLLNHRRNR